MKIVTQFLVQKLDLSQRTIILHHQGKSDLESSFPRKLRAWQSSTGTTRFVICRDNDGADCQALKKRLVTMSRQHASHDYKIRIVMNELEAWYLGDLAAIEKAGLIKAGAAARLGNKSKFRNPETLQNAKAELQQIISVRGQTRLANLIGPELDIAQNGAASFGHFVNALRWAGG